MMLVMFRKAFLHSAAILIVMIATAAAYSQEIYDYQPVQPRWATAENPTGEPGSGGKTNDGRKGRAMIVVDAGESVTLAEVSNTSGTVRRIWMTFNDRSPVMLRGLRIQCFWDGAAKPAVDVPLGDFFSVSLGIVTPFQSALFASPEGRSFNSFVPMPFRRSMKIVLINESGRKLDQLFYEIDYTVGDKHGKDMLYLHAFYHNQNPTHLKEDFEVLPHVAGRGRFLGASFGVIADKDKYLSTWWGEGEVKIYLDGDTKWPTLNGTGSEDYTGTGYGMHPFSNPFEGVEFADEANMRFGFYRWHVPDPIFFSRDIRVTIQQIGFGVTTAPLVKLGGPIYAAGPGLVEKKVGSQGTFEREDDWSSCAWFYLDRPDDDLPALEPAASRLAEVSRWSHE